MATVKCIKEDKKKKKDLMRFLTKSAHTVLEQECDSTEIGVSGTARRVGEIASGHRRIVRQSQLVGLLCMELMQRPRRKP